MGKIAFVFAGQGAQYPGMGKELCEISPSAKAVFERAEQLRPGTMMQCFEGSKEELALTLNTQPCLYSVDLAAAYALSEAGIRPDCLAGFSLGEVAALAFAEVFEPEKGFLLVCKRAELMQKAAEENEAGMVAVLKLPDERVEALCREHGVWPVNYNCDGQLVVSGMTGPLTIFTKAVGEAGGRVVPLAVSGGFHSPLMASASEGLLKALVEMELKQPRIPVYANVTAQPYGENLRELLTLQVKSPVLWRRTVENMLADGVDTFIEVGPGTTLSGLIKRIAPGATVLNVQDRESYNITISQWEERHADR